jgi:hypothetical protein
VWGNGESTAKLIRATFLLWVIIAIVEVIGFRDPSALSSYGSALFEAPQVFFWCAAAIVVARLIAFGFFMSIIIKRFNRR